MRKMGFYLALVILLNTLVPGCSPYEMSDPTCAKVTMIDVNEAGDKKGPIQDNREGARVDQSTPDNRK
jgi:hypothetical protein